MRIETFWSKVDKKCENECWNWNGIISKNGYGKFGSKLAHRISYELCIAEIPPNMTIDHLCRNRICVNPLHLEVVSLKENILRGEGTGAKNARKGHCSKDHILVPENIYSYRGWRQCRKCKKQDQLRRTRNHKLIGGGK
jgi:hypothetical protein